MQARQGFPLGDMGTWRTWGRVLDGRMDGGGKERRGDPVQHTWEQRRDNNSPMRQAQSVCRRKAEQSRAEQSKVWSRADQKPETTPYLESC